jgi:GNAT superfamily N-acetyltransferase
MDIDIESLETATLDAVAPTSIQTLPGWLLPFDNTTIGRAISAVPVRHTMADLATVSDIESRYQERGMKTQFRIAEVAGLSDLRQALLKQGYTPQQPTLTMVGSIDQWPASASGWEVAISAQPTTAWNSVYLSESFDPIDGANRVKALSRSRYLLYATVQDKAVPIAAGTAALSEGWVSLHGMRTKASSRGMGCARALIATFGQEALKRNLNRCFLQVEAGNETAIRLYCSLGFRTAWLYHYWRKST